MSLIWRADFEAFNTGFTSLDGFIGAYKQLGVGFLFEDQSNEKIHQFKIDFFVGPFLFSLRFARLTKEFSDYHIERTD